MAQQLRTLQSLWAMERRRADAAEWPLQTQLAMIRDAGFNGAGVRFIDSNFATDDRLPLSKRRVYQNVAFTISNSISTRRCSSQFGFPEIPLVRHEGSIARPC
jgi:hypothetical protein